MLSTIKNWLRDAEWIISLLSYLAAAWVAIKQTLAGLHWSISLVIGGVMFYMVYGGLFLYKQKRYARKAPENAALHPTDTPRFAKLEKEIQKLKNIEKTLAATVKLEQLETNIEPQRLSMDDISNELYVKSNPPEDPRDDAHRKKVERSLSKVEARIHGQLEQLKMLGFDADMFHEDWKQREMEYKQKPDLYRNTDDPRDPFWWPNGDCVQKYHLLKEKRRWLDNRIRRFKSDIREEKMLILKPQKH